ncbi:MAG: DUF4337 domain-containing protein [Candidatus Hydrogenedentes bacterium]|nr:DUF4337 domain-containing protein [Candidatus Hydrogenedentota bacterium]
MAQIFEERWTQWVAMTTTVLAVCAAISALRGSSNSTKAQLATTEETNMWSYFQSKSIKQHACELHLDTLKLHLAEATNPEVRQYIEKQITVCEADIARYDGEKGEIKTQAESVASQENDFKRHSASFGMAAMLLQIGIMMSSVSALLKKKPMWVVGLGFGVIGLGYMAYGFIW